MNLATTWLGLPLPNPFVAGASPLVDDLDAVRRLEDAGAAAVVMHSLFEEQLEAEARVSHFTADRHHDAYAEALSFFPDPESYHLGPTAYLRQIARIKKVVKLPLVASLNGTTASGWIRYAAQIQEAGADALELNIYRVATDADVEGAHIDDQVVEVAAAVRAAVRLPLAVKLSPYYSSLPHLVRRLEAAGVDGLVLFNRFLGPDIDPVGLDVRPRLELSTPAELPLRLRWTAILHGRSRLPVAVSGGVHDALGAVKALMAGASAVQVVSALLRHGPQHVATLRADLEAWMREHEYSSVRQMQGSMSLARCPDPAAFERANYAKMLTTWRPGP